MDTASPAGKVMFTLIEAMAKFERSIIRERVIAGMAKAKAKGTKLGRPRLTQDSAPLCARQGDGHAGFSAAAPRVPWVASSEYSPADRRGHSSTPRSLTL